MSDSKLSLGGFAGNPGFSMPSPYYSNGKYHTAGVVWIKRRPARVIDMKAFIAFMAAQWNMNPEAMEDKVLFDSLSLRGKKDPLYSSAWDLSNSHTHPVYGKNLPHRKIVELTTGVTMEEAIPYVKKYRQERRAARG